MDFVCELWDCLWVCEVCGEHHRHHRHHKHHKHHPEHNEAISVQIVPGIPTNKQE
jgi:hypothetical protein